jgi:16S rRNA C967 or C1407 C5-methylase (RsmB/RsmF family)
MKNIPYLDMLQELLSESEFLKFKECYNNPIKKSLKILNHRWYNNKNNIYDEVKSTFSQERDLSEPTFSYNWKKYNDVLYATRKEDLPSSSLWSHYLHQAWLIYVQEMAASLSVQVLWVNKWDVVLDMCAAPWWKSIQIADQLTDWFLISNEIDSWRKKALESNLHRCGIYNVWVIQQDGCIIWDKLPETFDKVLVDAPCSWEWMQYKSDKKIWQRDEKKSKKLSNLQIQLLISWLKSLKVWGELVYSTCTTNVLENEYVVSEVLKQYSDWIELLKVPLNEKSDWITSWRWNKILSPENAKKIARLWPHIHKTWGFFIAKFKKKESLFIKIWEEWSNSEKHIEIKNNFSLVEEVQDTLLSQRWVSSIFDLDYFVSKFTINIAPKSLIQNHFENKTPNIEIWLPIFKTVKDSKNNAVKLIPLIWIAQVLGHLATKNIIEINDEQLTLLMEKRDLIDNRLKKYEWNNIILKWHGAWIWLVSVQKWIWKNKCF